MILLQHLNKEPYELHLAITVDRDNEMTNIPSAITTHRLKKSRALVAILPVIKLLNQVKPDVVLSGTWNLNLILTFIKPYLAFPYRLILYEGSVASYSQGRMKCKSFYHWLCRSLYPNAEIILSVSDYVCNDLITRVGISGTMMRRIYNPIDLANIESLCQQGNSPFHQAGSGPHVIMVGRLSPVKNHAAVIASFPRFLQLYPQGHLWILGMGILYPDLQSLVNRLELMDRVHFVGIQQNPFLWMKHADLFVLPSLREGLGNVLIEAIACGCPVVSTCAIGGVPELLSICRLEDRLVERWDWQARWLERPNPETRKILRCHFGIDAVIQQYEELFSST